MVIYDKPNYLQVTYQPDKHYILFHWTNFGVTVAEIKEAHEKALATAQEKGCYHYIAETSMVRTVLSPDVVKWFGDVWVPKLIAAGLRSIVTVVPSSALATMSTHSWQTQVVGGITMKNAQTLTEAEAIIKELQTGVKAK